jgi:membrane protein implicated in regulation of membrane protease activity
MLEAMLEEEVLEITIAGVALGIIILAMLTPRGFALPILLIGVFLFVVGLFIYAGVAALVLVGIVGFCAALAGEHYLWKKRKKSKERSQQRYAGRVNDAPVQDMRPRKRR